MNDNREKTLARRCFNWLLGQPEEINGHERCPTYLYRWAIVKRQGGFAIYLHHFVGDDWSRDLHDHPKRFISIGLKGAYLETTPADSYADDLRVKYRWYRAPWIRSFPATHIHRIEVASQGCWTLVIVLKTVREWGFWHHGHWYPWKSYVNGEYSGIADRMKSCD